MARWEIPDLNKVSDAGNVIELNRWSYCPFPPSKNQCVTTFGITRKGSRNRRNCSCCWGASSTKGRGSRSKRSWSRCSGTMKGRLGLKFRNITDHKRFKLHLTSTSSAFWGGPWIKIPCFCCWNPCAANCLGFGEFGYTKWLKWLWSGRWWL